MASSNLLVNALRGALIPTVQRREEEELFAAQQAEAVQKAQAAQLLELLKQSGRSQVQGQRDAAALERAEFTEGEKAARQEDRQKEDRRKGRKKRRSARERESQRRLDDFLQDPESITDALIQSVGPQAQELLRGARSRGDEVRGQKQADKLALEDRRSANIAARQRPRSKRDGTIVIPDSRQFAQDVNDLAITLVDTGQIRMRS